MKNFYTDEQMSIQERFHSRELAKRVEETIVTDFLEEPHKDFIKSMDFFFLSTVAADGCPTVSYKGGSRGFVSIIDSSTIAFPNYDGNGMFLSMGNIQATNKIGILFIDFETPNRLRLQCTATVSADDPLVEKYPGANLIVRVHVNKVFINCARYIHNYIRVKNSPYIPDEKGETPFPSWKRIDLVQDVLTAEDRSRVSDEGGEITIQEYEKKLEKGES